MPNPTKRAAQVKARRMYATRGGHYAQHISSDECVKPIFTLPADPASLERMIAQGAEAIALRQGHP